MDEYFGYCHSIDTDGLCKAGSLINEVGWHGCTDFMHIEALL